MGEFQIGRASRISPWVGTRLFEAGLNKAACCWPGRYGARSTRGQEAHHDRQQVGLAIDEPFGARQTLALWAVPVATAVLGDANQATVITPLELAAKRPGTVHLDGSHHTALVVRARNAIAVAAEDVRHLQRITSTAS